MKKRTPSKETRAKISAALTGRKRSAQTRARISMALKGRRLTPEHRAKISKALKKLPGNFTGKRHTPETKAALSRAKRLEWMEQSVRDARVESIRRAHARRKAKG